MKESQTVLLVEDDPDDVLLTQIAFEKARLVNPLQIARDGAEAIEYLEGRAGSAEQTPQPLPTMFLLDIKMPRMDGFEVLEWMRGQPGLKRMVVIVLTASDLRMDVNRAYDLGAVSYLIKPPNAETLVALVGRLHAYWLIVNHRPEAEAVA